MSKTATDELDAYTNTRNAWVTPNDQMRATIAYDTSIMIFKNLTGRFTHIKANDDRMVKKIVSKF